MGIKYLNGKRLKHAIIAAAQRVVDNQERLNSINVFPVADADTGTNMSLALKQVAIDVINGPDLALDQLSRKIADSALMGARGNSGAILAQFFQGLAEALHGYQRVDVQGFALASRQAVTSAIQALVKPQAGTILTVMSDWSEYMQTKWPDSGDFVSLLKGSLRAANASLDRTPQQLKVLAAAGVVDAGAQGFVNMLEGVEHLIDTGKLEANLNQESIPAKAKVVTDTESITYRYCSECLIRGQDLEAGHIRAAVERLGDSLIVAGSSHQIKIHIHTNQPEELFQLAAQFGEVRHQKADDMHAQHQGSSTASIALIVDSCCDLPEAYLILKKIRVVPVSMTMENKTYLDRVNITADEVYRKMGQGIYPTTSQPAPRAFLQAIQMASEHHEKALIITLASKLSGTWQAAVTAIRTRPDMDIRAIDSRTVAGAMGMLVRLAVEGIEEGLSLDQLEKRLLAARSYCRLFASFPTLEHLIRGGRVGPIQGFFGKLFKRVPIISLSEQGEVIPVGRAKTGKPSWHKVMASVEKACEHIVQPRFMVGHAHHLEAAAFYAQELKQRFGVDEVDILDLSPTIGTHVGLGAAGICLYGLPEGVHLSTT